MRFSPNLRCLDQFTMDYKWMTFALLCLCSSIMQTAADVIAISPRNFTNRYDSLTAAFGPNIKPSGMEGLLATANPIDACHSIDPPPPPPPNDSWPFNFFALIKRGSCDFDKKVYNAQKAGFMGAIVYNDEGNILTTMSGSTYARNVLISSVFVGLNDGLALKTMNYTTGFTVALLPYVSPSWGFYFLPFISVTSTCLLFFALYAIAKYVRDQRRRRKARLSRDHLRKLPTKKFKKGDDYDVCAICLDDYEEGQKLRILPCNHAFHCKCVDPWLTNNRRTCPICKRKVVPPGMADSDEESDSEAGDAPNENTPLLAGMETDNMSDRGAVGGMPEISTPPPSPAPSSDDEERNDNDTPVVSLISVESDTTSAGSFPMEEAASSSQASPGNVLSVTVHSENEMEPICGNIAPKV